MFRFFANIKFYRTLIALGIVIITFAILFFVSIGRQLNKPKQKQVEIATHDLDIVFGLHTAPHSIYLYSNYSCSHCHKFFVEVFPKLQQEYLDNGKVNLILRLVDFGDNSYINDAYRMAVCINAYGNYAHLHELFIAHFKVVESSDFIAMMDEFTQADDMVAQCYYGDEAQTYLDIIKSEFTRLQFKGTPTFIIGNRAYTGFLSFNQLVDIIDKQITF